MDPQLNADEREKRKRSEGSSSSEHDSSFQKEKSKSKGKSKKQKQMNKINEETVNEQSAQTTHETVFVCIQFYACFNSISVMSGGQFT